MLNHTDVDSWAEPYQTREEGRKVGSMLPHYFKHEFFEYIFKYSLWLQVLFLVDIIVFILMIHLTSISSCDCERTQKCDKN